MFCRRCGYSLEGLRGGGSCPECGTYFDSRDPLTYEPDWPPPRRAPIPRFGLWIAAGWPLAASAWLHLMLLVARLELGRWPSRHGPDDPKGIPVVASMMIVEGLLLPTLPLSAITVLALVLGPRHTHVRPYLLGALAWLLWSFGLILLLADPTGVLTWFFD